jgi:hypothetical protein
VIPGGPTSTVKSLDQPIEATNPESIMNKLLPFEFSTVDTVLSFLAIVGIAATSLLCIVVSNGTAVFV